MALFVVTPFSTAAPLSRSFLGLVGFAVFLGRVGVEAFAGDIDFIDFAVFEEFGGLMDLSRLPDLGDILRNRS